MSDNLNKIDSSKKAPNVFMSVSDGIDAESTTTSSGSRAATVSNIPYVPPPMPPAPVADFTADPVIGTFPLSVNFTDTSLNSPTSWAWDFENDGIYDSTLQNPVFTYNTPGTYSVKMTAISPYGANTVIKSSLITVEDVPVVPPTTWYSIVGDSGGPNYGDDYGSAVAYDSLGNLYTIGGDAYNGIPFIVKYDKFGNIVWHKNITDQNNYYKVGDAIAIDQNDNVYITVSLDDIYTTPTLIKLTPDGDIVWQKEIVNEGDWRACIITKLRVDANNNLFAIGFLGSPRQTYLMKFSLDGVCVWQKIIDIIIPEYPQQTNSDAYPIGLDFDSAGNVYVLCENSYVVAVTVPPPYIPRRSGVLLKFDQNGNTIWAKEHFLTNGYNYVPSALDIYNDEICIVGNSTIGDSYSLRVINIAFIDTNGTINSEKSYECTNLDAYVPVYGLVSDSTGNRYFSGASRLDQNSSQDSSVFVFKLDANKNLVWSYNINAVNPVDFQWYYWVADTSSINTDGTRMSITTCSGAYPDSNWSSDCITFQLDTAGTEIGTYEQYWISNNTYFVDSTVQQFSSRIISGTTSDMALAIFSGFMEMSPGTSVTTFYGIEPPGPTFPVPVADFITYGTTGTAPFTVYFEDSSTNFPNAWAWDFQNDGSVDSTLKDPSYVYANPGTYSVKLTVFNPNGQSAVIKENIITVLEPDYVFLTTFASPYVYAYSQAGTTYTYLPSAFDSTPTQIPSYQGSAGPNMEFVATVDNALNKPVIYKRTGSSFNRLPDLSFPGAQAGDSDFSPDGKMYVISGGNSPKLCLYNIVGDTFTYNPTGIDTQPTANVYAVKFSPNGQYLAVSQNTSSGLANGIQIYKVQGDNLVLIPGPNNAYVGLNRALAWSSDSTYLVSGSDSAPTIRMFKRVGDTFTYVSGPFSMGSTDALCFSKDGTLLYSGNSANGFKIWQNSGDTLTYIGSQPIGVSGQVQFIDTNVADNQVMVTHSNSPYITIYNRSSNTLTKNNSAMPTKPTNWIYTALYQYPKI